MVIVAVKDNPGSLTDMGLHLFDEQDWPRQGYTMVRRVDAELSEIEGPGLRHRPEGLNR